MDLKYQSEASFHGFGVFATSQILAGERILKFRGTPITLERAYITPYALQVSESEYIEIEGIERYVNHRCQPNCGILPGNQLVALKPIPVGEEITFDYSSCVLEDGTWSMTCQCDSERCRGSIEEFDKLPLHLQLYYWKQGCVTDFISRQCADYLSPLQGHPVPYASNIHHHKSETQGTALRSSKLQPAKV